MPKKTIGIIGGIGPDATADIFKRIIDLTPAKKDQDHIHIVVDNNPQVPSRVEAILQGGKSPLPAVGEMAVKLEAYGCDFLIIPCNTMSFYMEKIRAYVKIPVLDIVEETSSFLFKHKERIKTVGLLGTEATIKLGLYQSCIIKHKLELLQEQSHTNIVEELKDKLKKRYYANIELDLENQPIQLSTKLQDEKEDTFSIVAPENKSLKNNVQKSILEIKAGYYKEPKRKIIKAIDELKEKGAQAIVLGCTEIPLVLNQEDVDIELIDPTQILAERAVEYALQ